VLPCFGEPFRGQVQPCLGEPFREQAQPCTIAPASRSSWLWYLCASILCSRTQALALEGVRRTLCSCCQNGLTCPWLSRTWLMPIGRFLCTRTICRRLSCSMGARHWMGVHDHVRLPVRHARCGPQLQPTTGPLYCGCQADAWGDVGRLLDDSVGVVIAVARGYGVFP